MSSGNSSFSFYFLEDFEKKKKNVGFPGGSVAKNPSANIGDTRDTVTIPGLGRFPGVGNANPLQYSFWENPKDRGAWQATIYGIAESDMIEQLNTHTQVGLLYPLGFFQDFFLICGFLQFKHNVPICTFWEYLSYLVFSKFLGSVAWCLHLILENFHHY